VDVSVAVVVVVVVVHTPDRTWCVNFSLKTTADASVAAEVDKTHFSRAAR
jgi:hypothetical protein